MFVQEKQNSLEDRENAVGRGDDIIILIFGNKRRRRKSIKEARATQKNV